MLLLFSRLRVVLRFAVVAAAVQAQHVHPEYSSLKRIVPAAAAIAVATVNAANADQPLRSDPHAVHRDVAGLSQDPQRGPSHNA